jgi:hypothetical protein
MRNQKNSQTEAIGNGNPFIILRDTFFKQKELVAEAACFLPMLHRAAVQHFYNKITKKEHPNEMLYKWLLFSGLVYNDSEMKKDPLYFKNNVLGIFEQYNFFDFQLCLYDSFYFYAKEEDALLDEIFNWWRQFIIIIEASALAQLPHLNLTQEEIEEYERCLKMKKLRHQLLVLEHRLMPHYTAMAL